MNTDYRNIPVEQKAIAVQRLTALWAFTESGLGGIMHAFKIPFTGLLVGGMALVMISLIAFIAGHPYKQVLKSAVIVLIVKAMVSPHTPPAAYMAVSFQALLGYGLFRMMGVNMISILFLSVVSMIESAVQKVIILTLFLGQSLWKAMDALVGYVAGQLGFATSNGSYWVIGIYMLIYIAGGFVVAWLAYRSIQRFRVIQEEEIIFTGMEAAPNTVERKKTYRKLWILIIAALLLSLVLFVFAPGNRQGWLAAARSISWTVSAIFIWYVFLGPLLTRLIRQALEKKKGKYADEVLQVLSFLPVLRRLATMAWQQSKKHSGFSRGYHFVSSLIHWSLIYSDGGQPGATAKQPA